MNVFAKSVEIAGESQNYINPFSWQKSLSLPNHNRANLIPHTLFSTDATFFQYLTGRKSKKHDWKSYSSGLLKPDNFLITQSDQNELQMTMHRKAENRLGLEAFYLARKICRHFLQNKRLIPLLNVSSSSMVQDKIFLWILSFQLFLRGVGEVFHCRGLMNSIDRLGKVASSQVC